MAPQIPNKWQFLLECLSMSSVFIYFFIQSEANVEVVLEDTAGSQKYSKVCLPQANKRATLLNLELNLITRCCNLSLH